MQLFHFHTGEPILITQRANIGKRENFSSLEKNEAVGFHCLGHSNWTICIPLSPFCYRKFPTFSLSYWEANSYYPRGPIMGKGNSSNPKSGWDRGFSVPGTFKLDHLHPSKPLLLQKISNFFTFILGGQFLLPQRANNGRGEFIQLQNWMRQWVFSAWGIQTGPFAACLAPFVLIIFQLFNFILGSPILITPEGQ